jgi:hypothetical protein
MISKKTYRASSELRDATLFSLCIQVFIVLLAGLVTDGGAIGKLAFFAFVSFNSFLASVLLFRPKSPTRFDLLLIRAGYIPTLIITAYLANYVWDIRGF